jgi:nitroreductase
VVGGCLACGDFAYDLLRWVRYGGYVYRRPRDTGEAAFRLRHYCHRLEKALLFQPTAGHAVPAFLPEFVNDLRCWLDDPLAADPSLEQTLRSTIVQYREAIDGFPSLLRSGFLEQLDDLVLRLDSGSTVPRGHDQVGGTVTVTQVDGLAASFNALVAQRHSARTFTDAEVPDSVLVDCVAQAQRSPSACNRQAVRVHVYADRKQVHEILRHQNGNHGFGNSANKLVLLTYSTRALLSSSERNLPYLDAGLFAMTLLLAFESQRVATCCLNLSNHWFRERRFRRACDIPDGERPVLLIAVGRAPDSYQVPFSARVPTMSVLRFHNARGSTSNRRPEQ